MDHVETRILSQAAAPFAFLVKSRRLLRFNRTPHRSRTLSGELTLLPNYIFVCFLAYDF
jgi:hypothetical protein